MNIIELPETVLELIMSYLSYDDIAKQRIVSRTAIESLQFSLSKYLH